MTGTVQLDRVDESRSTETRGRLSYFHLAGVLAIPRRKRAASPKVLSALDAVDRTLVRGLPAPRKDGWMVVLRLAEPVGRAAPSGL